jgi:mycofactocin precursor
MQQDIRADAALTDAAGPGADDPEITGELLVEEVSIDGMCGVY